LHPTVEDDEAVPTVVAVRLGVDGVIDTVKVSVRWPWLRWLFVGGSQRRRKGKRKE
jgi:hypothetical protein